MPSQILLSDAQRLEFTSVPETVTDEELEYFYTLRDEDKLIVESHRGEENRLGFAMTICCLRHKGWPYNAMTSIPPKVISYVYFSRAVQWCCSNKSGHGKVEKD